MDGIIVKALSGFYYVETENGQRITCRARGKFRKDGQSPLVGDYVEYSADQSGNGTIERICKRKNSFIRPAVANIDMLVFIASNTNPVTDPWLIDRISVICADAGVELLLCLNKTDIDPADELYSAFVHTGIQVLRISAVTGEGIHELVQAMRGRVCAFSGNSGVGKSSILNAINPMLSLKTSEVSDRLGRGKHTTRHVELFKIADNTYVADTPGFASFEVDMIRTITCEQLETDFIDFRPLLGNCRFNNCRHLKEPGCAVRQAVDNGIIIPSRYQSYCRLYELTAAHKPWE